jgi:hypothetical protein
MSDRSHDTEPIGQRVAAALTPAGEQTLGIPAFAA